ncbi:LOW QUALITY PROTEIN: DnaJ-like protein subfamily C member 13 [Elysia marginata]|uniref:DnaJ-like protein subfamily C member 13 n=1 Tax=Elysia marginata TaxID=1093978 RepID=A0AAV4EPX2_9GAST|nr:LOW QUALITY PROTEIN: DnaJ-like protein subfamily C member 13 [Elysia marginata]
MYLVNTVVVLGKIFSSGNMDTLPHIKDRCTGRLQSDNHIELEFVRHADSSGFCKDHFNKNKRNQQLLMLERKIDNVLQHWRARIGVNNKQQQQNEKPIVLRKRRQRIKSEANWPLFYYQFNQDHAKPNLLWNYKTREELRESLENEMRAFTVDKELGATFIVGWNHAEFEVPYVCLAEEIKIGDYYLRLLLEEDDDEASEETSAIKKSYEFFNDLYHRFLLTPKVNMKCMCLQAMAIVYGRCHEEIGAFNDTRYMVGMLERCTDRLERDRLILFLNRLILHQRNVKEVMDANGVKTLVDLLTIAHLHTTRATVPLQTNVIEAGADMKRDSEKEWYYGNKEKERLGPFSFEEMKELYESGEVHAKTRCWAQGMDGWRPLQSVPQLKWMLLATGQAVLNETDMAILILNMLIKMVEYYPSRDSDGAIIRPLPRIKRILSDATCLPHIVQLLLTFDPILVEKVALLLYLVMQDNPGVSRLYLSGAFFFIMMYTGSNVLPVARFLKYTHLRQAFRSEENATSDVLARSVLGPMLPEAMVCYLENYSPDKFAQIFLGEFDTPEAIWNNEMRRLMIEKIASHLADFSPRLQSNTRALFQYCPMPSISYPQLDNELFCNIYYLKHLCDTQRFPDWPIKDPIRLLKDILDAWKREVEKKPPTMSLEEAYEVLNLSKGSGGHEEAKIRKAYFKMARDYHPDKNPEGREMFEQVNKAYEFLCSKAKVKDGPDPQNIVLILKAQSILFSRYKEDAFSRCVNVLTKSSKQEDVSVLVCTNIARCYSVSAQFEGCREKIQETSAIIKDLCRILYFKTNLFQSGVLWHLLLYLFNYDYTLEEGGVDRSQESNQQEVANHLAKMSVEACGKLAGFYVSANEQSTPDNPSVKKSLYALLTPYMAKKLTNESPVELLKILNSNTENPYLIWDNATRAQLSEYLNDQQQKIMKSGDCDPSYGADFVFEIHAQELIVGDIFVRIFNEQPMFVLENPKGFTIDLLDYLGSQAQYLHSQLMLQKERSPDHLSRMKHIEMALEALRNIIKASPGVEIQCIGHFKLLFALLRMEEYSGLQQFTIEPPPPSRLVRQNFRPANHQVINCVTGNQECVKDIAASEVLGYLLFSLQSVPACRVLTLESLFALMSNTKIVKEAMVKGCLVYLLDLFCNATKPEVREKTAELMAKMLSDKLVGPKVRILLNKFLPPIFMDAMRDSPEASVHMFEGSHENPELIWNDEAREKVCTMVIKLREKHVQAQRQDANAKWSLSDDFQVVYSDAAGEVVVGGVFLRLFIANPAWVLRRPKEFLTELMEQWTKAAASPNPNGELLETLTKGLVFLFEAHSSTLDQVPSLGYIPRIFHIIEGTKANAVPKSAIEVVHQLANNELCIRSMASIECIAPIKRAMKIRRDAIGLAAEALAKMFDKGEDELVKQALAAELIPFLLKLLEGGLEAMDKPAATKAQIVKALKAMQRSLAHGERVIEILDKSSVWKEYKDQRHDLFISDNPISGFLTAGAPSVAGYLTAGSMKTAASDVPPPVDHHDE